MAWPQHAQERFGVHGPRTDLDVDRLLQRAATRHPELGQLQDQALERHRDQYTSIANCSLLIANLLRIQISNVLKIQISNLQFAISNSPFPSSRAARAPI